MTIPPDLEAQILRYHHVEKWRAGTIARQFERALRSGGESIMQPACQERCSVRRSQIEPYLPFIRETLESSNATASRLFGMVRERGYRGRSRYFRPSHCPPSATTASRRPICRLRTLPATAQVGLGTLWHLTNRRARRPLMLSSWCCSWSRQIFLRFFLDARMESFCVVMSRRSRPSMDVRVSCSTTISERCAGTSGRMPSAPPDNWFAFAAHYRYEPRPVAVARGNEKAASSAPSAMCADSFFAARKFTISTISMRRRSLCSAWQSIVPCPEQRTKSVREAFAEEVPRLLQLPDNPFPLAERVVVKVARRPMSGSISTITRPPHGRATHTHRAGEPARSAHRRWP